MDTEPLKGNDEETLGEFTPFALGREVTSPLNPELTLYLKAEGIDGKPEILIKSKDGESYLVSYEIANFLSRVWSKTAEELEASKIVYKIYYANLIERFGLYPAKTFRAKENYQYHKDNISLVYSFVQPASSGGRDLKVGDIVLQFIEPGQSNKLSKPEWHLLYWGDSFARSPLTIGTWNDIASLAESVAIMQDEEAASALFALAFPSAAATLSKIKNDDTRRDRVVQEISEWEGVEKGTESKEENPEDAEVAAFQRYPLFIPKQPNSVLGKILRSDAFDSLLKPDVRKKNLVQTFFIETPATRVNLGLAIQLKYGADTFYRDKNRLPLLLEALKGLGDWEVFGPEESSRIAPQYNANHFSTILLIPTPIATRLGKDLYLLKNLIEFGRYDRKAWF